MIVQRGLLTHHKFILLKKAVGPGALEYLVRLWGHCEVDQRGARWPNASAAYVEAICDWPGERGVLFKALASKPTRGKHGFVERHGKDIVIHDWDLINASLIQRWKAARKYKSADTSADTSADQRPDHGRKTADALIGSDGGEGSNEGVKKKVASLDSRTQWAALQKRIKRAEAHGRNLSPAGVEKLEKLRAALAALERKQSEADFTTVKTAEAGQ